MFLRAGSFYKPRGSFGWLFANGIQGEEFTKNIIEGPILFLYQNTKAYFLNSEDGKLLSFNYKIIMNPSIYFEKIDE